MKLKVFGEPEVRAEKEVYLKLKQGGPSDLAENAVTVVAVGEDGKEIHAPYVAVFHGDGTMKRMAYVNNEYFQRDGDKKIKERPY